MQISVIPRKAIFKGEYYSSAVERIAVETNVVLLRSLSNKYIRKMHEPPYSPCSYELNTTATLLHEWLSHQITHEGSYAFKQWNQTKAKSSAGKVIGAM